MRGRYLKASTDMIVGGGVIALMPLNQYNVLDLRSLVSSEWGYPFLKWLTDPVDYISDSYYQWVQEWRLLNQILSHNIRLLKKMRKASLSTWGQFLFDESLGKTPYQLLDAKVAELRQLMHRMYRQRMHNKEQYRKFDTSNMVAQ